MAKKEAWELKQVKATEYIPEPEWEPFAVTYGAGYETLPPRPIMYIWLRRKIVINV